MKKIFLFLYIAIVLVSCTAYRKVIYEEENPNIVNPERVFYIPTGTKVSHFIPLNVAVLKGYRNSSQQVGKANSIAFISL